MKATQERPDIVRRLRALAKEHHEMLGDIHKPLLEAAKKIIWLRNEVKRLKDERLSDEDRFYE